MSLKKRISLALMVGALMAAMMPGVASADSLPLPPPLTLQGGTEGAIYYLNVNASRISDLPIPTPHSVAVLNALLGQ